MKHKLHNEPHRSPEGLGDSRQPRTLILGDSSVASYIQRGLERRGCKSALATSSEEAAEIINRDGLLLVISTWPAAQHDPLLRQLVGTRCTVVCHEAAPPACRWLLLMRTGAPCFNSPVLSPFEVMQLADEVTSGLSKEKAA